MQKGERIIRLDNDRVYLTTKSFISISKTNIPIELFSFKESVSLYFRIVISDYKDNRLLAQVVEYNPTDITAFHSQTSKAEVDKIFFRPFDWTKFEPFINYYHGGGLKELLKDKMSQSIQNEWHGQSKKVEGKALPQTRNVNSHTLKETSIDVSFFIKLTDTTFDSGEIKFTKKINELRRSVDFTINNQHILKEFEHIKEWFALVLKTKRIRVNATITFSSDDIISTKAESPEIGQINPQLISSIDNQRVNALFSKTSKTDLDKTLYDAKDLFKRLDGREKGNVFQQSEFDILENLLKNGKIRNASQLKFLSKTRQTFNSELRYTLPPQFGFLFTIPGKYNNHFVWELLNSHATYVWSVKKTDDNVKVQYDCIIDQIQKIQSQGRREYQKNYTGESSNHDMFFTKINHKVESNDGYITWEKQLRNFLK